MSSADVVWQRNAVSRQSRWKRLGQRGATVWFTGLPAAGKSSLASHVEELLIESGRSAYLLDGDNLRHGLCADLNFEKLDRDENVRRAGEVACLFADAGTIALVALVSPYLSGRQHVRDLHDRAGLAFVEVFLDTPLAECESRDPKGLYRRARAGEVAEMTGVDSPYEPPERAEVPITPDLSIDAAAEAVLTALSVKLERPTQPVRKADRGN